MNMELGGEIEPTKESLVVAPDLYAVPPHTGRGDGPGTRAPAGWMYRAYLEFTPGG